MPRKYTDLTGMKVGMLTVLHTTGKKGKYSWRYWLCKCNCGKTKEVVQSSLVNGLVKSCGCLLIKQSTENISNYNKQNKQSHE